LIREESMPSRVARFATTAELVPVEDQKLSEEMDMVRVSCTLDSVTMSTKLFTQFAWPLMTKVTWREDGMKSAVAWGLVKDGRVGVVEVALA